MAERIDERDRIEVIPELEIARKIVKAFGGDESHVSLALAILIGMNDARSAAVDGDGGADQFGN